MIQQVENKENTKNKRKPLIITAIICTFVGILCGCVILIYHIRQQRLELQNHILTAKEYIENGTNRVAAAAELVIVFYMLVEQAETLADDAEYDAAIGAYEEAKLIAAAVSYTAGINLAESGVDKVHELILIAKRNEAMNLYVQGNDLYNEGLYAESLEFLIEALDIFMQLEDQQNIILTLARINYAEQKILEAETEQTPVPGNTDEDIENEDITEINYNYQHNINIDFDLRTPIDNQRLRPASDIRMGTNEGYNEGWYNGCGWIAAYNAMIILGNPVHPAEIVRSFEENVGIVLGGVFGTYPNAIEDYLRGMGHEVKQTLFPQLSLNIDDVIKASKVSILAYLHTSAAHYITIEYREDIDKFIVYNDGFARTRSESLGLKNETNTGAAIDSVAALISNTPNILFSFSLIVVS